MHSAFRLWLGSLVLATSTATTNAAFAQREPSLDIELVTEGAFNQEDARKWFDLFESIGLTAKIRGGKAGDRVALEPVGDPPMRYRITGILTPNGKVDLPGGRFGMSDKAGIQSWATKIRSGGEEALFDKPAAFGLTERQLAAAKKDFASAITTSTKDQSPQTLVDQVLKEVAPAISLDGAAQAKLQQIDKFPDELSGLSGGTALAALLRPAGLAVVPSVAGKSVQWQIVDSQSVKEVWPVGWKPTKPVKELVPDLLKFIDVEIEDTPVSEVLEAVGGKLKIPVIVDQNSLARERIDLATTNVTVPSTKTFYQRILDRALFQAKLKSELRVDEADRPFLWITTVKQK